MTDLSAFETSILRALSETEPRTIFAISGHLTGTESAFEMIEAIRQMCRLSLTIAPGASGPQRYLRTAAGTELLAGTKEGVEE